MNLRSGPTRFGLRSLLLLCSFGSALNVAPQVIPEAERLRVQAQKLYQTGDLDGAVAVFRKAVALRPTDPGLLYLFAQALGDQGSFADSESAYLKVIALYEQQQSHVDLPAVAINKRNIATCLNNLAVVYLRDKRPGDAQTALDRAMATWTPASSLPARFHVTRGQILEAQTHSNLAIESYRTALAGEPSNTDALLDLGILLLAQGERDEALSTLRKGVTVNPKDAEMFAALGNALAAKDLWDDAISAYKRSLGLRPDSPTTLYNLADSWRHQGKFSEALEVLQRAHALAPDDGAITGSLNAVAAKLGSKGNTAPISPAASSSGKSGALAAYELANGLASQGRSAEAIPYLQNALRMQSDFPEAACLLGTVLLETGKVAEAKAAMEPAMALHPNDAQLHDNFGIVLLALNKPKEADTHFLQALSIQADYDDARVNHAIALTLQHRSAEALPDFQKVLQSDPKNLKAQVNLASALFELHRYSDASDAYARSVELSPADADLRNNLGIALQRAGRADEAKKVFADAKRLRPAPTQTP